MRGNHLRRFTLLQCCLLAALLIHAALLVTFRYVPVAGGLVTYVAREVGLVTVTVNLNPRPERPNAATAPPEPAAGEPPDAGPAGRLGPSGIGPSGTGPDTAARPADVPIAVPRASVGGAAMSVAVAPPVAGPPAPPPVPVAPTASPVVVPDVAPIDVRLGGGFRVQQAESAPVHHPPATAEPAQLGGTPAPVRPAVMVPADLPAAAADAAAGSLAVAPAPVPSPALPVPPVRVGTSPAAAAAAPDPEIARPPPAGLRPPAPVEPGPDLAGQPTPATRPGVPLATLADAPTTTTGPTAAAPLTPPPPTSSVGGERSLAQAAAVAPRAIVLPPATPLVPVAPAVPDRAAGPDVRGIEGGPAARPKIAAPPAADALAGLPAGGAADTGGGSPVELVPPTDATGGSAAGARPSLLAPAVVPPASVPGGGGSVPRDGPLGPPPAPTPRPNLPVASPVPVPVPVPPPPVPFAGPQLSVPQPLAQRSPEQRRPVIERLGGNKASETAVDRGLAYLARVQEPDGRWTHVTADGKKPDRPDHDAALTGLAVLAFLGADHSPARGGPYAAAVARGVDWIVSNQSVDGDLRGRRALRGGGSARANMYDHGIATMAVAEAALMTNEKRYVHAATRAAHFICDAQNKQTGGWRYLPGEPGDTSVFGWQVMALHNAELLGFRTPPEVRRRAIGFLSMVSSGRSRVLAGYVPGEGPSPAMTAEALFCRVLLGQPIDGEQAREAVELLGREPPAAGRADLYYWYYASLSLSQLQANPQVRAAWDRWNERCRDTLVATQATGGDQDGSWTDRRWGEHGGQVFATALATLTLEVYYRYLPLGPGDPDAARTAWQAVEPERKPAKPRGPVGPKFEAN